MPPEYDHAIYTARNPDLAGMDETAALSHYAAFGHREGRTCSVVASRAAFLALVPADEPLLEIGPYTLPAFRRPQHQVDYLDAFTTEELRAKAAATMPGGAGGVPEIDYVWRGEPYADLVGRRYRAVFSAHNVEHQPDLIGHLRGLDGVLLPGRRVFFAIPDRRYCFDHYLPSTTFADAFGAFYERRRTHTAKSVFEHRMLTTHNDAARHWRGDHGEPPLARPVTPELVAVVAETMGRIEAATGYLDTHAWQFTPDSFRALIAVLSAAGVVPFGVERVYRTVRDSKEFYAVLSRG
jgi:hypothetical protein